MVIADDIYLTVIRAKCTAGCWGWQLRQMFLDGINIECFEKKFMLLVEWISIMEDYYCANYDESKSKITPALECLTESQALQLLAKIKELIAS